MPKIDCVDVFISSLFKKLGGQISRTPLPFLLCPLVVLAVLCVGCTRLTIEDDVEHLFTPVKSPGRIDLKTTQRLYMTGNEGEDFLPNRELDLFLARGRLILSRYDGGNILEPDSMADVYKLDKLIRSTSVPGTNGSNFDDVLCMRWLERCVPNPIIVFYENHQHEFAEIEMTYPIDKIVLPMNIDLSHLPPGKVIGGMDQWGTDDTTGGGGAGSIPPGMPAPNVSRAGAPLDKDLLALMNGNTDLSQLPPNMDPNQLPPGMDPNQIPPLGSNQSSGMSPAQMAALLGATGEPITLPLFLGPNLGNVSFYDDGKTVKSATHLVLFYTLNSGPEYRRMSGQWEDEVFMVVTEQYKNQTELLKVDRVVSTSLATEVNQATHKVIPRFAVTFCMMIVFAVLSGIMRDWVLSKPWLGLMGVLSAGMSIVSAIGLLSFMGIKYNEVVSLMPFLIIGKCIPY